MGLLYVSQFAAAEIMDHVKLTAPRTKVQDKAYEGSIYTSISWRHILTSLCGASVMDKPPLAFKHSMRDISSQYGSTGVNGPSAPPLSEAAQMQPQRIVFFVFFVLFFYKRFMLVQQKGTK